MTNKDFLNLMRTPHDLLCKLEDGTTHAYEACAPRRSYYPATGWKCIGRGRVWKIDGKMQKRQELQYFFVRREK